MDNSDLERLVKLLSHPASEALQQRHLCGIELLCRQHQQGFFISELVHVQKILDVTLQLIREGGEQYVQPTCEVLRILSQPLLRRTSADELRIAAALIPLLESICKAFTWRLHTSLQQRAAEVVAEMSSLYGNRPPLQPTHSSSSSSSGVVGDGISPARRLYEEHAKCIKASGIMSALVQALDAALNASPLQGAKALTTTTTITSTASSSPLSQVQQQQHLVAALLQALLAGSYISELSEQILKAGGCSALAQLLQQCTELGATCKQLPTILELCWNLVELAPEAAAAVLGPQPAAFPAFAAPSPAACEPGSAGGDSSPRPGTSNSDAVLSEASSYLADGSPAADQDTAAAAGWFDGDVEQGRAEDSPRVSVVLEIMVNSLTLLMIEMMSTAEAKQAKELRNDALVVLTHLAKIPGASAILAAEYNQLLPLLVAATVPELEASHPCICAVGLTLDSLDCEMKAMVWGLLSSDATTSSTASSSISCVQEAVSYGLLQVLLMYAEGGSALAGVVGAGQRRWSGEQLQLLQRHAWARLMEVAPAAGQEAFALAGGFTRCSRVLSSCSSSPQQVASALQLLSSLVSADAAVAAAVCQQGLLEAVLQQLQDQEQVCTAALQLLVRVCEVGGAECTKAVKAAGAIPALLEQCQFPVGCGAADVSWTGLNPSLPSLPALASLVALWSCILPAAASRAELLAHDGMDVLLTALANGNTTLRPLVLSVLADLLADSRSHPFFHEWYQPQPPTCTLGFSPTANNIPSPVGTLTSTIGVTPGSPTAAAAAGAGKLSAAGLLLGIWRQQQHLLGMADVQGVLQNVEAPWEPLLGAKAAGNAGQVALAAGYGYLQPERRQLLERMSVGYTPLQMLDKVYACIKILGPERLGPLSPGDAATLKAVDAHLQLVQGAVWVDLGRQWEEEGVELTQEDRARLASGIQHGVLVATHMRQVQTALLGKALAAASSQEQALYDALRTSAKNDMVARLFKGMEGKLTLRERLAAKGRKEEMLARSMARHNGLISMGLVDPARIGAGRAPVRSSTPDDLDL